MGCPEGRPIVEAKAAKRSEKGIGCPNPTRQKSTLARSRTRSLAHSLSLSLTRSLARSRARTLTTRQLSTYGGLQLKDLAITMCKTPVVYFPLSVQDVQHGCSIPSYSG